MVVNEAAPGHGDEVPRNVDDQNFVAQQFLVVAAELCEGRRIPFDRLEKRTWRIEHVSVFHRVIEMLDHLAPEKLPGAPENFVANALHRLVAVCRVD
jgi:hypothetical protein